MEVDMDMARKYCEDANKLGEQIGSNWSKYVSYSNMAYYYTLTGNYTSALDYDIIALRNSKKTGDSSIIAEYFNMVGHSYYDLGRYDEAYSYFTEAYSIARGVNDSIVMTIALHNVGCVFKELGQLDKARSHLNLSRKISKNINDLPGDAYYFYELADVLMNEGKYDSALLVLQSAKTAIEKFNLVDIKPRALLRTAKVYALQGKLELAEAYYDSTYAFHRKNNNNYGQAEVALGRGTLALQM